MKSPRKIIAGYMLRIIRKRSVLSIEGMEIPIDAGTISIHSDTPHAEEMFRTIRRVLRNEGIAVKPLA